VYVDPQTTKFVGSMHDRNW